jgi:hypothetical protein
MKKIAADKNYRMFKKAGLSPRELIEKVISWYADLGFPNGPSDVADAANDILISFKKNNLHVTREYGQDDEPTAPMLDERGPHY